MEEEEPLRLREITAAGLKRVKGSFAAAVSLSFLALIAYLGFQLAGRLFTLFLDTLFLQQTEDPFSANSIAGLLSVLLMTTVLLSPFQLNLKSWYQGLEGGYLPLRGAFSFFMGSRRYFSALWFAFVRGAAVFLAFLLPLLPSLFLTAVVRVSLEQGREALGSYYAVFMLLSLILAALGLVFSLYIALGWFLADYLYVLGVERNPFRALPLSWRLMRGRRPRFLRLLFMLLPLGLLCLLLAPVPFVVPLIRSTLAVYASGEIRRKMPAGEVGPLGRAAV